MKKMTFLGMAVALSIFGGSGYALASTQPMESGPNNAILTEPAGTQPTATQPAKAQSVTAQPTALVIAFPKATNFDISNNQQLPTTLILAQPLVSNTGTLLADVNSPVQATLVATDEGARVQVEAVVSEGKILPIQAVSATIPFLEESSTEGQKAGRGAGVWGRRGIAVGCLFNNCSADNQMMGGSTGALIGSFLGQGQSSSTKLVQIPQGSIFILQIQESAD